MEHHQDHSGLLQQHYLQTVPCLRAQAKALKLLHQGPSSERFYSDMCRLEAMFDQDAARIEQDREENTLEAAAWLKDLNFDPAWYENMDD
ncbi:hypothetical protein BDR06DRAFT_1002958 [Suillus hirtellus]|nr:hypothetical protein BDR06DRAFT_1002958 [Suillus hirtellus]